MIKYKIAGVDCIVYGAPEGVLPDPVEVRLLDSKDLPIYSFNNFKRDRILEREGILSFEQLQAAYFLLRLKSLDKPRRVRDAVMEKYQEVLAESEKTDFAVLSEEESSETPESEPNA